MIALFRSQSFDCAEKDNVTIQTQVSNEDLDSSESEGSIESIDLLELGNNGDEDSYYWYDDDDEMDLYHRIHRQSCIQRALTSFTNIMYAITNSRPLNPCRPVRVVMLESLFVEDLYVR